MEKIQQLLNQYKKEITNGHKNIELRQLSGGNYWLYARSEPGDIDYISLSEILFNTPFLSWLEWKKGGSLWAERDNIDGLSIKTLFGGSSDYHKINLVLLSTDEERIIYIKDNTL